jgi:hypothetical protein
MPGLVTGDADDVGIVRVSQRISGVAVVIGTLRSIPSIGL